MKVKQNNDKSEDFFPLNPDSADLCAIGRAPKAQRPARGKICPQGYYRHRRGCVGIEENTCLSLSESTKLEIYFENLIY